MLQVVDKYDLYKYFLAEGGRGGGKSQGFARMICYLCDHYKLRNVCGREIQKNIEESVYTIFVDLIKEHELNFEVYKDKLVQRKTGATIGFKGFRDQGSVNIKGLEGVDILWIDEAQSITQKTLDVIIPTIRKAKAKVFFSMNRHLKSDPVYKDFITREDCLHIHIGYQDNPYCSEELKMEARICLEKSQDDYDHIWGGQPREEADNFLFTEIKLDHCKVVDFLGCGHHEMAMGVDIARYGGDHCVAVILQKRGPIKWETKHVERWSKKDLMETTGRIIDLQARFKPQATAIDADGMGAGVVDRMSELKANVNEFRGGMTEQVTDPRLYGNLRTEWFCRLEELISKGWFGCQHEIILKNLELIQYTHKSNGQKMIISKEIMKSKGIATPVELLAFVLARPVLPMALLLALPLPEPSFQIFRPQTIF